MARLLLHEQHRSLGAEFTMLSGQEVPRHYGDPLAEHEAVRLRAGVADLSARALWRVTGPDRAKYLQGTLTNDILALTPGSGCYAALLDVKGHLQADLRVYALEDHLLLDLDPALAESFIQVLKRYVVIYKVKWEEATPEYIHLALSGPQTAEWLRKLFGQSLPSLPDYHFVSWQWQGQPVRVIQLSETGEAGVHLLIPSAIGAALWTALLEAGTAVGARPIGCDALESLRIEAAIPKFGVDMDGTRFPAEAGIKHAISYTKGCYLGQETTMRIETQGSVNRRLVGLLLDSPKLPRSGEPLMVEGRKIGLLTSVLVSPTLKKNIAMAYLQKGFLQEGTTVTLSNQGQATVIPLPFYQQTKKL